jgi:hypothetical protein
VPLHTRIETLKTSEYFKPLEKGENCILSNISGEPKIALYCGGLTPDACDTPSRRIAMPPFSSVDVPPLETRLPEYVFFTKPNEVISSCLKIAVGTSSTFDVNSRITFGAPVEKKEK